MPQLPAARLSSWEGQDISISHPVPSYLLLKLRSRKVWQRGEGSLLPGGPHSWDGGYTLGMVEWVFYISRGKLRKFGMPLRGKYIIVPTPCNRAVAQRFCLVGEAGHRIEGSKSSPSGNYFICNRVWKSCSCLGWLAMLDRIREIAGRNHSEFGSNLKHWSWELSLQRSPNLNGSVCGAIYIPGHY